MISILDHGILFFVNGCFIITDEHRYIMRFLIETIRSVNINLLITDRIGNTVEHNEIVNGLSVLEVDCTDFMDKYNWENSSYKTVGYTVNSAINGSFPLISPTNTDNLNIVCVSGNNNKNINDTHNYEYETVYQETPLWSTIINKHPDIVIHTGDQIYADYIFSTGVGKDNVSYNADEIYSSYADMYRSAYSETYQSVVMRNCLNIMCLGTHDIADNFGVPDTECVKTNNEFTPYYQAGIKAFYDYQYSLKPYVNSVSDDLRISTNDIYCDTELPKYDNESPLYYSLHIGKYTIVVTDTNNELYHKEVCMSDQQLEWIDDSFKKSNKDVLLVLARPIGDMNTVVSYISGIFSEKYKNDMLYYTNYNSTIRLLDILEKYKNSKNTVVVAGHVKKTFINSIYTDNNELIAKQLVVGAVTRTPKRYNNCVYKLGNWLQQKLVYYDIDGVYFGEKENVYDGNSFGCINNGEINSYHLEYNDKQNCCFHCKCI